jgi:hypothetical protein
MKILNGIIGNLKWIQIKFLNLIQIESILIPFGFIFNTTKEKWDRNFST